MASGDMVRCAPSFLVFDYVITSKQPCVRNAGQCGSGRSLPSVTTPTVIKSLAPLQCTSVGAGMAHTVVCTVEGGVYCWGGNEKGQLGDGGEDAVFQVCCRQVCMANDPHFSPWRAALCRYIQLPLAAAKESINLSAARILSRLAFQCVHPALQPKLVESALLDNEDVVKVACGARHTLALTRRYEKVMYNTSLYVCQHPTFLKLYTFFAAPAF